MLIINFEVTSEFLLRLPQPWINTSFLNFHNNKLNKIGIISISKYTRVGFEKFVVDDILKTINNFSSSYTEYEEFIMNLYTYKNYDINRIYQNLLSDQGKEWISTISDDDLNNKIKWFLQIMKSIDLK